MNEQSVLSTVPTSIRQSSHLEYLKEQDELNQEVQWIHTKSAVAVFAVMAFAALLIIPIPMLGLPLAVTIVLCAFVGTMGVSLATGSIIKNNHEVTARQLRFKAKYFNIIK